MKKTLLLLMLIALRLSVVNAQTSGGPDAFGYTWKDSNDPNGPTYNWVDIVNNPEAIQIAGLSDDNIIGPFNLNHPFHYYWYDVNQFWVGSNGYIGFTNGQIASNGTQGFPNIPDTNGVHNFLGAFLTDLNFGGAGNTSSCWFWQSQSGDSVVVTYEGVPFWQQAAPNWQGSNTFQIILNNNDSSILFQYNSMNGTPPGAQAITNEVGIENSTGAIGMNYLINLPPASGIAVKFYYPPFTTFQVDDASVAWSDNAGNQGKFLTKNGPVFTMSADIMNSGTSSLPPFNVTSEISLAGGGIQVSDITSVGALAPGAHQYVQFNNPFYPINAGLYQMTTTTQLPTDATPSNNSKVVEINVVDASQTDIELAYEDGTSTGTISWSGGDGGIGVHFVPPFYPCSLTAVDAFIVDDPNLAGYSMLVYADDGTNNAPGTLLDSVNMPGGTFALNSFDTTMLTNPITINSGGFYVLWYMDSANIVLGSNNIPPLSHQMYEVLGGTAPTNFAKYRNEQAEDLMVRAIIQKIDVACSDSLSAGTPSADETTVCFGDEVNFTSSGVIAPTEGSYYGIGWVISSADISGSIDPMNDPSVIGTTRFLSPATSETSISFTSDSALIGNVTNPFGTYYFTPVIFGNATGTGSPVLLGDLTLDTSCILTGASLMVDFLSDSRPAHDLTSNSPLLCDSLVQTINLNAPFTSGATYQWTGPNGFTSNAPSPSVTNATAADSGWYYVSIASTQGCLSTDSLLFVIDAAPHAEVTVVGPLNFCSGADSVILTASQGSAYLWSPTNETTQSITVTTTGGTYSAVVTNPHGCTGSASTPSTSITVRPSPAIPVIFQQIDSIINNVSGSTYQWYLNGNLVPNKITKNIRISAGQNGNWYVVVTNGVGCSSQSNTIHTNVGLNELENDNFLKVYPNPSKGVINVELSAANVSNASVKIADITGREIFNEKMNNKRMTINLKDKSKGIYYLLFNDGNKTASRKIVLQ